MEKEIILTAKTAMHLHKMLKRYIIIAVVIKNGYAMLQVVDVNDDELGIVSIVTDTANYVDWIKDYYDSYVDKMSTIKIPPLLACHSSQNGRKSSGEANNKEVK